MWLLWRLIYLKVINSFIHKFEGGEWIAVLGLMIFAQMEVVGGLSFCSNKIEPILQSNWYGWFYQGAEHECRPFLCGYDAPIANGRWKSNHIVLKILNGSCSADSYYPLLFCSLGWLHVLFPLCLPLLFLFFILIYFNSTHPSS